MPKRIDFATDPRVAEVGQRLPYTLYKYRSVTAENAKYVRSLIVDGELFFSTAAGFNDPFECQVAPSFEASENAIREYVCEMFERQGKDPLHHQDEIGQQVAKSGTAAFREEARQRYLTLTQTYGIGCLTKDPFNLLMWSYYADGHKGIAVGIDTVTLMKQKLGAPFFPLDVQYSLEFPIVRFFIDDDFELARKTLATKAKAWEREEEWRWILVGKAGVVRVQPQTVSTVTLGLRTPRDVESQIRQWIAERRDPVTLQRIQFRENSFALEAVPA